MHFLFIQMMAMRHSYTTKKLFTGEEWLKNATLTIENDIIIDVEQTDANVDHQMIIPALIDLQIYGAGGKLLSVYPEAASVQTLNEYCKAGGAAWFQPTVATNTKEIIFACVDAVRTYMHAGGTGCIGLHVEGPWINKEKRGAHIADCIYSPSAKDVQALLDYGQGIITMITLAPEVCTNEIVSLIQSRGVVVSAGHSNATYAQATMAFDNGIKTATHLYNAMSGLQHRALGMVGAILDHHTVRCSVVPDGYHVDFPAIRIAKKLMGERLFAITDAVTETSIGAYPHLLNGDKYEANGILSGSALTMLGCVKNLHQKCNIELGEAIRMCSVYPAAVMQKRGITGMLKKGERADFLCLNENLELEKAH